MLYADDMFLFLKDPGPSPCVVFRLLDQFAVFSGLRVNWDKSTILPLYFLCNSPVWVPRSFFNKIYGLFRSFIWGFASPKIRIRALQEHWGQGGSALLDLYKYFLAGQGVFLRKWLLGDDGDSATVLEAIVLSSYESLCLLSHRGSEARFPLTITMRATLKAWDCSGPAAARL